MQTPSSSSSSWLPPSRHHLAERLTFNYRQTPERPPAATFATAPRAESRDWGFAGLLAFTAVLLLRPQDHIPALKPLHLAEVCALIGLGPMILHRLTHRTPTFRVNAETIGLLLFGVIILATAPFSIWPGGSITEFGNSYLKIVLVFILMMNTLTSTKRLERVTWLILLCVGTIAAMGVLNYARGMRLVEGGRLSGPVGGIFGNPNDLATNMVAFLPVAIVMAFSRRLSMPRRLLACVIVALMLATIVFTQSRGGALGLVAAILALAVLGRTMRRGFGTITVIGILLATPLLPQSFWSRMVTIVDEKQDKDEYTGSRHQRRVVLEDGINAFTTHPLTGVGLGQFKNYNPPDRRTHWLEAHNALVQVAADTGLFGLLAFLFLMARAAAGAWETRRLVHRDPWKKDKRPDGGPTASSEALSLDEHTLGVSAGLIGWFVCAMFASVAYGWTFYYLLALIVATRELAYRQLPGLPARQRKKISRTLLGLFS